MVLISGATGLLGGHLLYRFRESAHNTIALYRNENKKDITREIFESYQKGHGELVDNFQWIKADLLEIPSLEKAMHWVETVYHCAASIQASSFEQMKINNITGTENVINVALSSGVKNFCYVSSISALGESIGGRKVNETDFFNLDALNTDYAISKFGAEMEAWRASQEGLNIVIVNPGIILGEGNWDKGSGNLFSKTSKGNRFYTSGMSGFVDVRDVTKLMVELVNSNQFNERFILIAENLTFKEVLAHIAASLDVAPPKYKLSKILLIIASLISYLLNFIGITKTLKRSTVKSLTNHTEYDNSKVIEHMNFKFTPIKETISRVTAYMLKNN